MSDSLVKVDPKKRVIYLGGGVDPSMTADLLEAVLQIPGTGKKIKPVQIIINSPGGELTQGFAIYDLIKTLPFPTEGLVLGEASSAASLILQACTFRTISSNSVIMIHDGSAGVGSTHPKEFQSYAKEYNRMQEAMYRIYQQRTKRTLKQVEEWCSFATWFTADEAIANGLADAKI